MILKSLKLENIRSYTHETIEFPEGSVLLSGDIGSGKSTILLAIEFALFGIMRAELSGESLLRHGKNNGSVELKFEIGKDEYLIKRALKKTRDSINQDTGYILTNGRKFEGTPVELKAKILDILGYPEELITKSKSLIYRYTVYTPQEDMKQILFEDKDTRLDTLRRLFGIDKYKIIKENAVISIRELRKKQAELKIKLESYDEMENEKKQKQSRFEEISKDISEKEKEVAVFKEAVKKEKLKLEEFEREIKKYNEAKKNLEVINAHIHSKKANRENLIKKLENTKEHSNNLQKKLELYSNIKELMPEKEIENEISQLSIATEKIFSIEEQIKALERDIGELAEASKESIVLKLKVNELEEALKAKSEQENLLENLKEKREKAFIALEKVNLQIKESEEIISAIKQAEICPTCSQKVDDKHREEVIRKEKGKLETYETEKEKINAGLKKLAENLEKVRRNLDKLTETEKTHKKTREQLIAFEEQSKSLVRKQKELSVLFEKKKHLLESVKEKGSVKEEIEKKKKLLSEIRDNNLKFREKKNISENMLHEKKNIDILMAEIELLFNELEKHSKEKIVLEKTLADYSEINEEYEKQKEKLDDEKEKEKAAEIMLASFAQEKKSLMLNISEIEKRLLAMEKIKSEIKKISEIESWMDEFFMNLMSTMEKHIMVSIHREFESLLKEWFSILIEDIDIALDDEFSVKIIQDGYETNIESLSGGEKTSVALAYRLALNKVINDLISGIKTKDFIILDEPTDGFSTEQLDKVREVLEELNMKQTIIVSHEPKMEAFVQNIIRVSKSDNVSKVSI